MTNDKVALGKEKSSDLEKEVLSCYQCKKCSAGCPISFALDILPHEAMSLIRYGEEERLLSSSTIWLCASCETCTTRCPNGIDIAGVMDSLRQLAIQFDFEPKEKDVALFHQAFLAGINLTGRTNESVLIGIYKAISRRILDDIGLGLRMIKKGKIKIFPQFVRNRKQVARLFEAAGVKRRRGIE